MPTTDRAGAPRLAARPRGCNTIKTWYVWCGSNLGQARNATNAVTRAYYDEGEFVPGTPAQYYYYGADQIGSIRRVFTSAGSAPAYAYDPYGKSLEVTTRLTDIGYAGMFFSADSGLYLTQFRVYDPNAGRWLSRDPSGEGSDPASNLYAYVRGSPIALMDPSGTVPGQPDTVFRGFLSRLLQRLPAPPQPQTATCLPIPNRIPPVLESKPPADAKDPRGAKAPGTPGEAEGFEDPKDGEQWVEAPNGKRGWLR